MNPDQTNSTPAGSQPASSPTISTPPITKASTVLNGISTTSMQNAINYAKTNPQSSYALELQQRIQSGQYNDVLKAMGKDTSQYGTNNTNQSSPTSTAPTTGDRLNTAGTQIGQIATGLGHIFSAGGKAVTNTVESGANTMQKDANGNVIDKLKSAYVDPVETGLQTAGDVAGTAGSLIGTPISVAIKNMADKVSNSKGLQDFASSPEVSSVLDAINNGEGTVGQVASHIAANHPELAANLGAAGNIAGLFGGDEGIPKVITAAGNLSDAVAPTVNNVVQTTKDSLQDIPKIGLSGEGASELLNNVKNSVSKGNVSDNLASSVERLANTPDTLTTTKIGETPLSNNPLDAYNKYLDQEGKFKGDAKQDTALGMVGTAVGNAYNKVIGMRRNVGALMGSEMAKVGALPTDISHTFEPLETELHNNGLSYDADSGKLDQTRTSKVSDQDKDLLEDYINKLNTLGTNPTAAELDAFLSKTPQDLDVFKRENNITKTTNGERIINQHLGTLAKQLTDKANPAFSAFAKAKKNYGALSNFLDEGSGFLGKKTASGDYAKDASLAKSSIQSALNGGKKDWLIKLEQLTGFPAIDHSMLALQAMKDAGNFRGSSLLDLLSPESKGKIPLSKEGLIGKGADAAINFGKSKFVGSPSEQTRRIIENVMSSNRE